MSARVSALKHYRKTERLTQVALGRRLGKDGSTIMRWERGLVAVPAEIVLDLERITGISRHDLRPDVYGPPITAKANAAG